jgi:hypothetical protein
MSKDLTHKKCDRCKRETRLNKLKKVGFMEINKGKTVLCPNCYGAWGKVWFSTFGHNNGVFGNDAKKIDPMFIKFLNSRDIFVFR